MLYTNEEHVDSASATVTTPSSCAGAFAGEAQLKFVIAGPHKLQVADLLWSRIHHFCLTLLRLIVTSGNVTIVLPDGSRAHLGDGLGSPVVVRLITNFCLLRMMLSPWYQVGAQYVDEKWIVEEGRLADLISALARTGHKFERETQTGRLIFKLRRLIFVHQQKYGVRHSMQNVEHHYDFGDDLFESFLDSNLNYTCADFERGEATIDQAQDAKIRNALKRLELRSGHRLLEIGCGWGALSQLAAAEYGAVVTGLTLSRNQLTYSEARVATLPSSVRPRYLLEDYRQHESTRKELYDRVVSIGMLEHVGYRQLARYFAEVARLLKPDGVALVHTIARRDLGVTNPWLSRNIFPGGYIAQRDEIIAAARSNGLVLTDRTYSYAPGNYIKTLRHWADRFSRSWPVLLKYRYPDRVRRTYDFYFAASEAAFRELDMQAVQFVFKKAI